MQDISEIRTLSKKLTDTIKITPVTINIISTGWIDRTSDLAAVDFQLDSCVNHNLFFNGVTKELFIHWDHIKIDNDLKGFFKKLIRILKISGTEKIRTFDECYSINISDELVEIKDHINFTSDNPLMGRNSEEIGTRFPDMSQAYLIEDKNLRKVILAGVDDIDVSHRTMELIKHSDAEVYNFSVFWMNILSVHASILFSAVCKVRSR
ncbi:MAG: hypothetical protein JXR69_01445 [Candidatus Delongbacteria bacterium]|nr:hypothetical protein [Candidatus Delongbacteria bacterium]